MPAGQNLRFSVKNDTFVYKHILELINTDTNMKKESQKKPSSKVSRRAFIGTSAAVTAGFTILPSNVIAGLGHRAPSDKLNIAGVGVGGRGGGVIKEVRSENTRSGKLRRDWCQ